MVLKQTGHRVSILVPVPLAARRLPNGEEESFDEPMTTILYGRGEVMGG